MDQDALARANHRNIFEPGSPSSQDLSDLFSPRKSNVELEAAQAWNTSPEGQTVIPFDNKAAEITRQENLCSDIKNEISVLQQTLALRSEGQGLEADELINLRCLLSDSIELPTVPLREVLTFVFKSFEVKLIEEACVHLSSLAKSEENFQKAGRILLMPATGLLKVALDEQRFRNCHFQPVELIECIVQNVKIPDVLDVLVLLWGKDDASRALALKSISQLLRSPVSPSGAVILQHRKQLVEFIAECYNDDDQKVVQQVKLLCSFIDKNYPRLAQDVRESQVSNFPQDLSSVSYDYQSSLSSVETSLFAPQEEPDFIQFHSNNIGTPENIRFSTDIDDTQSFLLKSPEDLEHDFYSELNKIEEKAKRFATLKKVAMSASTLKPQAPVLPEVVMQLMEANEEEKRAAEARPKSISPVSALANELRRANKRARIQARLQGFKKSEESATGEQLTVTKTTYIPKEKSVVRQPSLEVEASPATRPKNRRLAFIVFIIAICSIFSATSFYLHTAPDEITTTTEESHCRAEELVNANTMKEQNIPVSEKAVAPHQDSSMCPLLPESDPLVSGVENLINTHMLLEYSRRQVSLQRLMGPPVRNPRFASNSRIRQQSIHQVETIPQPDSLTAETELANVHSETPAFYVRLILLYYGIY